MKKNDSTYFKNTECKYFPCHNTSPEADFNCLFCYCPLYKLLSKVGRSSLSFELPLGFKEAEAYRKANGKYVRKNQWRDTTVTVEIDLD